MQILPKTKNSQKGFIDIISAVVLAVILIGTATTTYLAQHGQDIRNFARIDEDWGDYGGGGSYESPPPPQDYQQQEQQYHEPEPAYNPPPASDNYSNADRQAADNAAQQAAADKEVADYWAAQQKADYQAAQQAAADKVAREDTQTPPSSSNPPPSSDGRCSDGSYNWDYAGSQCPDSLQPTSLLPIRMR